MGFFLLYRPINFNWARKAQDKLLGLWQGSDNFSKVFSLPRPYPVSCTT